MLSRPRSPPERTRSRMSKNGRASVLPDLMSLMAPSCSTTNRRLTSWGGAARWTGILKPSATNSVARAVPATDAIPLQEDRESFVSVWAAGAEAGTSSRQSRTAIVCRPTDSVGPFDRTTDRVGLGVGRRGPLQEGIQSLSQIMARHGRWVLPVVVDLPRVPESALPVEDKEVGSMGRPVSLRDRLRRVTEVREVEAFGFGALDHPREAVFRVVLVIVRIDGDELDPAVPVVPLDGDHPIFVGLDIRAVVTAEDHHENRCAGEGIQAVGALVHAREVERRRAVANL